LAVWLGQDVVMELWVTPGIQEVTRPDEVAAYRLAFAQIRDATLTFAATRTYLGHLSQTQQ
jgi:hypothetical protein